MDIYIGKIGLRVPQGPYSETEIVLRIQNGLIDDSCLAWTEEMADWEPVRNVVNGAANQAPFKRKEFMFQTVRSLTPSAEPSWIISKNVRDVFIWIDGIRQPSGPAFAINIAVDELLKREFDSCRKDEVAHPLMVENGVNAKPWQSLFEHKEWRENFKGIQHLHEPTRLQLFGAVDDIWVNEQGELIVEITRQPARTRK